MSMFLFSSSFGFKTTLLVFIFICEAVRARDSKRSCRYKIIASGQRLGKYDIIIISRFMFVDNAINIQPI